jgi:hypothetical protein
MLIAELNRSRRIGTEYEMTLPLVGRGTGDDVQRVLADVLSANGIRAMVRGYDHTLLPPGIDVAVEYDSSVQGESRYQGITWLPVEIKTRILNGIDDWEAIVPKTLEIARYLGARVNASTGHHLHLSFDEFKDRTRVVRSLWNLLHRFEPIIFGFIAPSRRHNRHCRPFPPVSKMLHGANSAQSLRRVLSQFDRYTALNLTHIFDEAPRIEFRHHHGTLDANKARHWLRFCVQLVQHAVTRTCQATPYPLTNDRKGLEKLLVTCGFKVNTRVYCKVAPELRQTGRYLLQRWKQFNYSASPESPPRAANASDVDPDAEAC